MVVSMLVGSQKAWSFSKECLVTIGVIMFVTIVFPKVVLHPTTVFGYGGGDGGSSGGGGGGAQIIVSAKSITNFEILGQVEETLIDNVNFVIHVVVPFDTDLTQITPTVSYTGGTLSPASGEMKDFTRPQSYTVSASDGSTRTYVVYVDLAPGKTVEDPNSVWFTETVGRTDMVRDGEVDIFDFNTLMVHWSDPSRSNPADVNKDRTVDVFDFNLLMIHWGKIED